MEALCKPQTPKSYWCNLHTERHQQACELGVGMAYKFSTQSPENKELWCPRMGDYDILAQGEQICSFWFFSVGTVHGLEDACSYEWGASFTQFKCYFFHRHPTYIHRNNVLLTLCVSSCPVKLTYKIKCCEYRVSKCQIKLFIFKQVGILAIQTCIDSSLIVPL